MSFLMLIIVSSNELKRNSSDSVSMKSSEKNNHCSNDSICPTWFTCNAEKRYQCDSGHATAIRCDPQAQISAVLNSNCMTYDNESKSTYVGARFYNCRTTGPSNDLSIQELPDNPEMLINNYYCVVTVKVGTVHWYYHMTSVVWSVHMGIRIGGNFSSLDFCP